jgi:hypothetical protein
MILEREGEEGALTKGRGCFVAGWGFVDGEEKGRRREEWRVGRERGDLIGTRMAAAS